MEFTLQQINQNDEAKEAEMGMTCRTHGGHYDGKGRGRGITNTTWT
jgi:hypothetical protein